MALVLGWAVNLTQQVPRFGLTNSVPSSPTPEPTDPGSGPMRRPRSITGRRYQLVHVPSRWPVHEFFLGSYYLFIPANGWVDTGIKIEPGNHILINTEGRFYPFQYQLGEQTSGLITEELRPEAWYELYSFGEGATLKDAPREVIVKPGANTLKFKVTHAMDMRVEVYRAWH